MRDWSLGLCLSLLAGLAASAQPTDGPRGILGWSDSPYRSFGPAHRVSDTALVLDEQDDGYLREALGAELSRLSADLFDRQGWPSPFRADDPLRIYVSRGAGDGVRRLAARTVVERRLVSPTIQIDAVGLTDDQVVREVGRLVALAAISSYGVADSSFLTTAAAELLSAPPEEDHEATRAVAASPSVRLSDHARTMGRGFLEEFLREAGGAPALRLIWERSSERGEAPLASLSEIFEERTGEKTEDLFLRFAARLYTALEAEPGPSRIGLFDLQAGALDASGSDVWSFRHRTFLPAESSGALRVSWPSDGARAAAVVRYRDPSLPPDVVSFSPGEVRTLPISGVSRIDWVVGGTGIAGHAAPAQVEPLAGYPFAGLAAQATASTDGPRVTWTTSSHDGLAGWVIFREQVDGDGHILRQDPQIVPAADEGRESYRYTYVDPSTEAGTYYRYTVWAVTQDGLLARAFSATLRTPE